jgi:hypothetical protein
MVSEGQYFAIRERAGVVMRADLNVVPLLAQVSSEA